MISLGELVVLIEQLTWNGPGAADDLCEAVYARGNTSRSDHDILDLARNAFNGDQNPWTVVKMLQDLGIIRPRLRPQWKGCDWEIIAPTLRRLATASEPVYIIDGSVGTRVERNFKSIVEAHQGTAFRRTFPEKCSPALIGFLGGRPQEIAYRLGWQIQSQDLPAPSFSGDFASTDLRILAANPNRKHWSWSLKRFTDFADETNTVSLVRESHPLGRDHDVYCVSGAAGSFHTLSRTAALGWASRAAGVALFKLKSGGLVAEFPEARLPTEVAQALRAKYLVNPGIERGLLSYPATHRDYALLRSALGHAIQTDGPVGQSLIGLNVATRLRGNATRLVWQNSKFGLFPDKNSRN